MPDELQILRNTPRFQYIEASFMHNHFLYNVHYVTTLFTIHTLDVARNISGYYLENGKVWHLTDSILADNNKFQCDLND